MFLHHFICSVHFPTVQKHTGFETIPHLYWKNDKGVKPANGFQPAFSGHSVCCSTSTIINCISKATTSSEGLGAFRFFFKQQQIDVRGWGHHSQEGGADLRYTYVA